MKLNYFVSFSGCKEGVYGSGRVQVETDEPIHDMERIVQIEQELMQKYGYASLVIKFLRLFEGREVAA